MPVIKPRARRVPMVRHICRLTVANRDHLVAYAKMIGDTTDHVQNQLVEKFLVPDPDYRKWAERTDPPAATAADTADSAQPDDIGISNRSTQRRP